MKDERIQSTVDHVARRGFMIYFVLMIISIDYRLLILRQDPREFWDFIAIFFIASLYGFIGFANKGILDHDFKKRSLVICISATIGIFAALFFTGKINSVADMLGAFLGLVLGMSLFIAVSYFLNRRWKRKEGIEDEK